MSGMDSALRNTGAQSSWCGPADSASSEYRTTRLTCVNGGAVPPARCSHQLRDNRASNPRREFALWSVDSGIGAHLPVSYDIRGGAGEIFADSLDVAEALAAPSAMLVIPTRSPVPPDDAKPQCLRDR